MIYDRQLESLLDDLEDITVMSAVRDLLFGYINTLSVGAMGYYFLPPPRSLDFEEKIFITRCSNAEGFGEHRCHHPIFVDPHEDRSRRFSAPILWSKICDVMNYKANNE